MPERRKTRTTGGQVKVQRATIQTTLKDLFQRTDIGTDPTEKTQDLHLEHIDPGPHPLEASDPQTPAQPSRPSKPSQLFPIFTKVSSVRESPRDTAIDVDDTEVIDISNLSTDIELSTESHLSSTNRSTPCSELGQATSHSIPPSPIPLDVHCHESDTSLPHAGTQESTHPKANKINGSNKRTSGFEHAAPLPSSCSQHVRGLQHSYTAGQAPLKLGAFSNLRTSDEGPSDFLRKWRQFDDTLSTPLGPISRSLTPQQCEEYLESFGRDYAESHPAFAQLTVHQEGMSLRDTETWTRRFRPRRANEVLGNEQHALYIRDWLSALELRLQDRQPEEPMSQGAAARRNKEKSTSKRVPRGIKRPRVIRAVTRKRGSKKRRVDSDDDLDNFVVFTDTDEEPAEDTPEDSEDELAFCQRTARLHGQGTTDTDEVHPDALNIAATETNYAAFQSAQISFADNLTNTLLITGPSGCGKTAAVYACAEELGWEIFEVYPGIGKRNGASLEQLVGEVGRNHSVQTVHRRGATKTTSKIEAKKPMGLEGYLAKSKTREVSGIAEGTEGEPISVEDGSPTHEVEPLPREQEMATSDEDKSGVCQGESERSRPIVRQSLVLFEEVDILFRDDAGFWPTVVEFIRSCQRPVVMTCNDAGLIPVGDLPVQKVLVFEPCPSRVAATFLQCVSLTEGCLVPHEDLVVLYESTHCRDGIETAEGREYARTEPVRMGDLRRSIMQLQIICAGARQGSTEKHQGDEAEVLRSGRAISDVCRDDTAMKSDERWREMRRQSELMSHVDAELCRLAVDMREGEGEESEMGYVVLETEYWERYELIGEEAIRHSRGVHEASRTGPMAINPAGGIDARVAYQTRMVDALQVLVGPPARMMGDKGVFLDYIPWVRHMVGVEDDLERRRGLGRGGRRTRNSVCGRAVLSVGLSGTARRTVAGSGLGGSLSSYDQNGKCHVSEFGRTVE